MSSGRFWDGYFSRVKPNLKIVATAIAAIALASMTSRGGQETESQPKWTRFEAASDMAIPIVGVRLNRSQGFRMALDFNIPDIVLDEFLVVGTGMKLVGEGETTTIDYYGSKEKVPVVYLDTLEVGGVVRRGIRTLLIQGDDIGARDGMPTYGRLGTGFLEPFRLTVHYPRKLFLLEPSPEGEVPPGGAEFSIEERYLTVDAEVNGTLEGRFVIDPGASLTTLDRKWARKNRLADEDAHRVDMGSFRVGGFTARQVPAILEDLKKMPYKNRPVGVIGASLLELASVTYDFPRRLVWLQVIGDSP
jgi:hypothetical protein